MGRQAHLARLALGRSPFEGLELDENGRYIMGLHAHETDNLPHYYQEYDERGHPKNYMAGFSERAVRDAKNDALTTVGVVMRREDNDPQLAWRNKTDEEKIDSLVEENEQGRRMRTSDTMLGYALLWWLKGLRGRAQTFRSYSTIPLLQVIKSEIRILGPLEVLTAGMMSRAIWFTSIRYMDIPFKHLLAPFGFDPKTNRDRTSPRAHDSLVFRIVDATCFILILPVSYLAILRSLHLLAPDVLISTLSFIPFTRESPLQLTTLPTDLSLKSLLTVVELVLLHPLTLEYVHAYIWTKVRSACYAVLCEETIQPEPPDLLSIEAADLSAVDASMLPALGIVSATDSAYPRVKRCLQNMRDWLFSSKGNPEHSQREQNFTTNEAMVGADQPPVASSILIDVDPESLWSHHLNQVYQNASDTVEHQVTQDSEDLEEDQVGPNDATLPVPTPLLASIADADVDPFAHLNANRTPPLLPPISNVPDERSFSERLSGLDQSANASHFAPEPSHRFANMRARQASEAGKSVSLHRVTALSFLPANCFASHTASLIATAITLPFEAMFLRSLTLNFLERPWTARPGASVAAMGIRQDVIGIGEWFGGNGGNWRYVTNLLLLLGLQGLVSTAVWGITTARVISWGKSFGWGLF